MKRASNILTGLAVGVVTAGSAAPAFAQAAGQMTLITGLDPVTTGTAIATAITPSYLGIAGISISIGLFIAVVSKFKRAPKQL